MNRQQIIDIIKDRLDAPRFRHSLGVEQCSVELAGIHGIDQGRASTAALLHDAMRCYNGAELLELAEQYGVKPGAYELEHPKVLHAPLGAEYARRELGVADADILNAIARHTIAAPGMSRLDKVIYIADAIEPGRSYDDVERLRALAKSDLDGCLLDVIEGCIEHMERKGRDAHPITYRAKDYYNKRSLFPHRSAE